MGRRPVCLVCLCLVLFFYVMDLAGNFDITENSLPEDLETWITDQEEVTICGEVERQIQKENSQTIYLKHTYLLLDADASIKSNLFSEKNSVFIQGVKTTLKNGNTVSAGSKIILKGKLAELEGIRNPGGFDERAYYACRHISYKLLNATLQKEITSSFNWKRLREIVRQKAADIIHKCSKEAAPYFEAILLGSKDELEEEEKTKFQQAGIIHILTISGLHIGILGAGISELLSIAGMGIAARGIVSFFLLLFYGFLTGSGAATIRAIVMFVMHQGGKILGRSFDVWTAIAFSAILLLVDCPAWLYSSSFLLSFSAIIGITVTAPILLKTIDSRNKGINSVFFSLALQSTMLPVLLYFNGEISIAGFWLNLFLLPTVPVVLFSGTGMFLTGGVSEFAGTLCAIPGRFLLRLYELGADYALKLPFTTWIAGSPSIKRIWLYVLFWTFFLSFLCYWNRKQDEKEKQQRRFGGTWGKCLGLLAFMMFSVMMLTVQRKDKLLISCLDVGQGDGVVIQTPDGKCFVSDFGSSSMNEVGKRVLIPYLKREGISCLDGIFLSHGDLDHMSGIEELLEEMYQNLTEIRVKKLWIPDQKEEDDGMHNLLEMAARAGIEVEYLSEGAVMDIGDVRFEVISPKKEIQTGDKNDLSLVYQISYGDFQALFTGDIGMEQEEKIIPLLKPVDFLKVAHHGSKYATGKRFLEKIKPRVSVISCSEFNRYGHPSPETVERLEEISDNIYYTMKSGAIMLSTDGTCFTVKTCL